MRALVTAFDPFGGESVNASFEAVQRLPQQAGALNIATAILSTSYARSLSALEEAIARVKPEIVLCVGQAGERAALCMARGRRRPGSLSRHVTSTRRSGGPARAGAADADLDERRHFRLQPRVLRAHAHRRDGAAALPRRLSSRSARLVHGARRCRARHRHRSASVGRPGSEGGRRKAKVGARRAGFAPSPFAFR